MESNTWHLCIGIVSRYKLRRNHSQVTQRAREKANPSRQRGSVSGLRRVSSGTIWSSTDAAAAAVVDCGCNVSRRSKLLPAVWSGGPETGLSFAYRRNLRSVLPARGGQCTQWVFSSSAWSRQFLSAQESRTSGCQEFGRIWFPVWRWTSLQLQLMPSSSRRDCILFGFQLCGHVSCGNRRGPKEDYRKFWGRFRSTSPI